MRYLWLASILLATSTTALAGTIYKCKNDAGVSVYQEFPCQGKNQSVSSWNARADLQNSEGNDGTLILNGGAGGHYFTNGSINDYSLNFAIDTGATYVTIPLEMAKSAGLHCQKMGNMETANGTTMVCATTIQKLTFGNFTLSGVTAAIAPGLSQPLLGMNVLKQFHIEQDSNQMRITKNY